MSRPNAQLKMQYYPTSPVVVDLVARYVGQPVPEVYQGPAGPFPRPAPSAWAQHP